MNSDAKRQTRLNNTTASSVAAKITEIKFFNYENTYIADVEFPRKLFTGLWMSSE